jgi:hypothetical protein
MEHNNKDKNNHPFIALPQEGQYHKRMKEKISNEHNQFSKNNSFDINSYLYKFSEL